MRKLYILAAVGAAALYYGFLPALWPAPVSRVFVPAVTSLGSDAGLGVTVNAWHPNFRVNRVRLFMEPRESTAMVRKRPAEPVVLYDGGEWDGWRASEVSRLTWPRSRSYELALPLHDYYQKGLIGPGVLRGEIEVSVDYVSTCLFCPYDEVSSTKMHNFEAGLKYGN